MIVVLVCDMSRERVQCCASGEITNWEVERIQVNASYYFLCVLLVLPLFLTYWFNDDRSARSPLKLITRFPDNPEIGTLHDNFV